MTNPDKAQLPPLPPHPEAHTMMWSKLERRAIELYGAQCYLAAISTVPAAAPQGLYEFLEHGDDAHRAWLKAAIDAFFAGQPRPPTVLSAPTPPVAAEGALTEEWAADLLGIPRTGLSIAEFSEHQRGRIACVLKGARAALSTAPAPEAPDDEALAKWQAFPWKQANSPTHAVAPSEALQWANEMLDYLGSLEGREFDGVPAPRLWVDKATVDGVVSKLREAVAALATPTEAPGVQGASPSATVLPDPPALTQEAWEEFVLSLPERMDRDPAGIRNMGRDHWIAWETWCAARADVAARGVQS